MAFIRISFSLVVLAGLILVGLVFLPESPLPDEWNPTSPLNLDAPLTPVTSYKLRNLSPQECQRALHETRSNLAFVADKEDGPRCHIRNQVSLRSVGTARLNELKTTCEIAARLYLWNQHYIVPAAKEYLNSEITKIHHYGSYSCRPIRTSSGRSNRMSEHASANAVDIAAFETTNGQKIDLLDDWKRNDSKAAFLRAARDGGCKVFNVTLGPDYNSLHADHFHFDMGRWRTCR